MRLRVMLALTLALLSCFFAAEGTSTNRENERQGQAAGAGPADINIQPNIGTPEKPEYALLSPDKRVLATSDRKRIKIWDISTGRLLRTLEHFAYNTGIAFAPDGHSIFAAYKDGAVRIWNVETGLLTDTIEVQPQQDWGGDGVWTLSIDEERQLLLAGTEEGKIFGWSLSRGLKLFSFDSGGLGRISSLGLSADGSQLVATGHDSVKWFDVRTRKPVRTYKLPNEDTRKDFVEYLGDELFLVRNEEYGCKAEAWIADLSSGAAEYMRILPPVTCPQETTGDEADREEAGQKGEPSILTHPAGGTLFVGRAGFDGFDIWDLRARRLKQHVRWSGAEGASLTAVSGDLELAALSGSPVIQIRQMETGRRIRDLGAQGYKAQTAFLSADQQTVNIMKSNGNEQRLVTLRVGAATPAFMTHKSKENLTYLGLSSAQGKVLAFEMNGYKARALYVFNATDGRQSLKIPFPEEREIWSVKISPDGSKIFPGGSLIDAASGKTLRELPGSYASFSQDGKLIAVAWPSDEANDEANYAEVWDVASLRPIKRISVGDSQCTSLLFSADGKLLVCGTRDAGIYIWNIPTGKKVKSFEREVIANHVNTASLALSADGKLIAAGPGQRATSSGDVGRETGIFVWDVASEKLRFTLRGHEDNVYALAFTPDGRWLSSASLDGTIRYWDMKTGAAAATFASSKNGRWAMISDKGFFAGSADAGDLLSVVRGYQAFSINQLWQSLYNPDLLREAVAGDVNGEVRAAAAVLNLDKVIDSGPAPAVEIVSPPSGSRSAQDLVTVAARIKDRGKGIGRIEWRVNGITVGVASAPAGAGPDYEVKWELALDPGQNAIEVVAYNASNLLASLPAQATISYTGRTDSVKPKLHILAIGIDAYTGVPKLNLAVADAKTFTTEMEKAGAGMYGEVRVRTVLDTEATAEGLGRAIEDFAAGIHPRDTFVLFAAAHGFSQGGRFYLIPQDYPGGIDAQTLAARAVGQERLQDWIANRIKAKKAIILLDTCESGALTQGYSRSRVDGPASEAAIGRLHEATGRPVLTAAAEGQEASELRKLGHGIFTYALLDALHHAHTDESGAIRVSDLAAYVQDRVPQLVAGGEGRSAIPRGTAAGGQSAHFGTTGSDFALVKRLQ